MKSQLKLLFLLLTTTLQLTAQLAVTMPGEFEKSNAIAFSWSDQEAINLVTTEILAIVQQNVDTVFVLYRQSPNAMDTVTIKQFLHAHGASPDHIFFIPANFSSPWIRDYGPYFGYASFGSDLERFVYDAEYTQPNAAEEDSIPTQLAHFWNWPLAQIPLEMEGGNVLHDGIRHGFSSTMLLERNPLLSELDIRGILREKFNLANWVFLESLHQSGGGASGNLDHFMQVIDFETLLVSSYPDSLPDFGVLEQNVAILQELNNAYGRPYFISRIPAAPRADGTFATTQDEEMRSYTNSLIINNQVFVPRYDIPYYDSMAHSVYSEAMPGYQIHMIDARALSVLHGGLRSISLQWPQKHYLRIEHKKIIGAQPFQPEVQITCISKAGNLVEEMWIHYKINSDSVYSTSPIYLVCPEHFGVIEGLSAHDTIHYYLQAISSATTTTYPLSAPDGNITFWFDALSEVDLFDEKQDLFLYPNPGKGLFTLYLPDPDVPADIQVYNLRGQLLLEIKASNNQVIDVQNTLSTGVYLIRLKTDRTGKMHKLIIY